MSKPSAAVTNTRFQCTIGRSDSATQTDQPPQQAPTTPMTTAQPIVASVGWHCRRHRGQRQREAAQAGPVVQADEDQRPDAEASSPGSATRLSVIPPIPAASMIRNAPSTGEPSRVLIAAKLPADAMIVRAIGGASFFARCTAKRRKPATDRDQGRFRPEHRTQAERGQRGENDAQKFPPGGRTAARLESESG